MLRPTDNPYGERILQLDPACIGLDVWELQLKLIGWGSGSDNDGIGSALDPVRVTGTFDSTTRDAVMRFQKAHKLTVTGIADAALFRALDRECAEHPVALHQLRCPCAFGKNVDDILCRCDKHPNSGVCTGFGNGRFAGKSLMEGKKLADDTSLATETLDIYDMEEYAGIDRSVIWAVRALMHRAAIKRIAITAGYKCWHDNYHHTDEQRWRHARSTYHFGKTIAFQHDGVCTEKGDDYEKPPCAECERIRKIAMDKCGFQLRWQEPNRVGVAEGVKEARPPATPWSVQIDTVRRVEREKDEFVKTHMDACKPLFEGKISGFSYPLELDGARDPYRLPATTWYRNNESGPGGFYPIGLSRLWHTGIHLFAAAATKVYAMTDGEIIGGRMGEAENAKTLGSRNFIVVKYKHKTKDVYTLYMHLDAGKAVADSEIRWRRDLLTRTKDHVEAIVPGPIYIATMIPVGTGTESRLLPISNEAHKDPMGLAPGDLAEVTGAELDPKTALDKTLPDNCMVVKLAAPADAYLFTKLEGKDVATRHDAEAGLDAKINGTEPFALAKPVKIYAGEVIGTIGAAPTDAGLAAQGSFLHLETFAAEELLTGAGYESIDATAAAKIADRKATIEALVTKKLLTAPLDGVLLESELKDTFANAPAFSPMRSVVLKMPSAWSLDWKQALTDSETFKFMDDGVRDALGDKFNEYRWWKKLSDDGATLPGSDTVFHFHPIVFLLQMVHG